MTRKIKPPIALYSALADATRCRIVEILASGPVPVHRLADAFPISRPAISRHLRVLKQAGLVAEVKKGRENLYAFRPQKLDKARAWLNAFTAPASIPAEEIPPPEPIIVSPAVIAPLSEPEAPAPEKPVRAARPAKKPDAITQMGFDF